MERNPVMIFYPKIGQQVRVHYRKSMIGHISCEGIEGEVIAVSRGPGPHNVALKIELWPDSKEFFIEIFPRGNLNIIK
jgi:hypothetical protein